MASTIKRPEGKWRTRRAYPMEGDAWVEDNAVGMDVPESIYREKGYEPPFDDLPFKEDYKPQAEVGDFIQRESREKGRFSQPRRVREVIQDPVHGYFVLVEGEAGAVPMVQVHVVQKGGSPLRPSETPSIASHAAGVRRATYHTPEGLAVVELPERVSQETYENLKAWFELALNRAKA